MARSIQRSDLSPGGSRAENRRLAWCVAIGFFCLYAFTAPLRIENIDGQVRFEVSWALLTKGAPVPDHPSYLRLVLVEGRPAELVTPYGAGHSLLGVPVVAAARLASGGSHVAAEIAFSAINLAVGAALIAVYLLVLLELGHSRRRALLSAILLGAASCAWPSALTCMEGPQVALCLMTGVLAILRRRAGARGALVFGAVAFGWLAITRETDAAAAVPLLAALIFARPGTWRERAAAAGVIAAVLLPFLALYAGYNLWRFDSPLSLAGRLSVVRQLHIPVLGHPWIALHGLTTGTQKGLLFFSPLAVVGLLGWRRLRRRAPRLADAALATFGLTLASIVPLSLWRGDYTWGPRYLFGVAPLLHLGLPEVLAALRIGDASAATVPSRHGVAIGRAALTAVVAAALAVQLAAISIIGYRYFFDAALELDYVFGQRDRDSTIGSQLTYHFAHLPEVVDHTLARLGDAGADPEPTKGLDLASVPTGPASLAESGRDWARRYAAFDAVPFFWIYYDLASGGRSRMPLRLMAALLLVMAIVNLGVARRLVAHREPS